MQKYRTEEVPPMSLKAGDRVAFSFATLTVQDVVSTPRPFPPGFDVRIVPVENHPCVTVHSSSTATKILSEVAE